MIEVAIAGAAGRMGRTLVEAVETSGASIKVGAASVLADDPTVGADIGLLALGRPLGVVAKPSFESQVDAFSVLIDFTSPEATLGPPRAVLPLWQGDGYWYHWLYTRKPCRH